MTAATLLGKARGLGVVLTADAGKLRYEAPSGAMTPALAAELRAHKAELLTLLSANDADNDSGGTTLDDMVAAWSERAAILEFDAGLSRADADRVAWAAVFNGRAH